VPEKKLAAAGDRAGGESPVKVQQQDWEIVYTCEQGDLIFDLAIDAGLAPLALACYRLRRPDVAGPAGLLAQGLIALHLSPSGKKRQGRARVPVEHCGPAGPEGCTFEPVPITDNNLDLVDPDSLDDLLASSENPEVRQRLAEVQKRTKRPR
jgi:hypothetical protein